MSTIYFKSHEITIYRKRRIGSTNRFSVSATLTAYQMDIQPETRPERVQMDGSRYGTMWIGFISADVTIKENDEVRVTDTGKVYSVKGVQKWAGAGLLDHQELTLISQDGN